MNLNLSMTARLATAGVRTLRTADGIFLCRNGVTTKRPNVWNVESVCLAVFNVVI